jgi:hypothetical protein
MIPENVRVYRYKTVMLPVLIRVGLRMLENKVMKRILGSKRDLTGGRRKLHNEELYNFCCSAYIISMSS